MGGCKCTYRNCSVKSDGQTHMFHYPVFDKVRCHQWLKNAQRLDFLHLKVSQLKNRVVCQHHFKPECFMNYKKDKLKIEAVPTENGPFCDAPSEINDPLDVSQSIEIAPEDIENDKLTAVDKAANFSLKYGNFLTNSDMLPDLNQSKYEVFSHNRVSLPSEVKKIQCQPMLVVPPYSNQNNSQSNKNQCQSVPDQISLQSNSLLKGNENSNITLTPKNSGSNNNINKKRIRIISEKKISVPLKVQGKLEPVSPSLIISAKDCQNPSKPVPLEENTNTRLENMEAVICNPAFNDYIQQPNESIENMEAVIYNPPNAEYMPPLNNVRKIGEILELPIEFIQSANSDQLMLKTASDNYNNDINLTINQAPLNDSPTKRSLKYIEQVTAKSKLENVPSPLKQVTSQSSIKSDQSPRVKSKIPAERVAAIEEKRNFNKKLRDMIEFCLDDPEKQGKNLNLDKEDQYTNNQTGHMLEKVHENRSLIKNNQNLSQNVALHLSNESNLPSERDNNLTYIEARMQRMEQLLLRKIDQNSQRLAELKDVIFKGTSEKKTVVTQTEPRDEEAYKKGLFNEISAYLTPEASSLIYEEMFLSKFKRRSEKSSVSPVKLPKRRRNR